MKPARRRIATAILPPLFAFAVPAAAQGPIVLTSPDGAVAITVESDGPGGLRWSVTRDGAPVLLPSPLVLSAGGEELGARVAVEEVQRRSVDSTWQRYWGKRREVRNRFEEVTLRLRTTDRERRPFGLVVRAYDDGAAFRWRLPEPWGEVELHGEASRFVFPEDVTVWAATYGGFRASQESVFRRRPVSSLAADSVYGLPVLVRVGEAAWAALTEADLTDWAGMWVSGSADRPNALVTRLAPLPGEPTVAVRSVAPRSSPWRVLLLASTPAALIASDLVQNLNDPPDGDFAWVRPGTASWDWWSGPWIPDADFDVGMNTATMKAFVDLAAEMGWEYVLVDEGWYGPAFRGGQGPDARSRHPTSRITTWIPGLDLPGLVEYAADRGVKVVLWLHWGHVDDQMDEAFPLFHQLGVAGVKIDFMDRDDQEMVRFYHRVARLAAENRLMVDFHGAYKPTGVSRTWPNLVTREGVLGAEYNKWSARVTPEHNVTIPFTRGLLGEMDYTPGGFRQKTPETFRARNVAPQVMGTRAHQLAMFVVYESAFTVASDSPWAYRISPGGTDFLAAVPTTWDDTRGLSGVPGDHVAVARRAGERWFVGAMSDERARTVPLPLGFLAAGRWRAEIWADAYEADEFPDRVMKDARVVTASDTLVAEMAPGGGYVAVLGPLPGGDDADRMERR